jgi:ACS family glucarate transporter-like MFS transporter
MEETPIMASATHDQKPTHIRWWIVLLLFGITSINYADRATISIVGTQLARDLKLDPVALGFLLSAFSISYVTIQIPGGWLLDRFGSRLVYLWSIITWSAFTALQGFVGLLVSTRVATRTLYSLRLLLGAAEAPSFPANSRIVAAWFPAPERGTAAAIFNSAQYFATVMFYPVMGLITHYLGWQYVFWTMGALGLAIATLWPRVVHAPREHPRANPAEIALIEEGGGLVDLDHRSAPVDRGLRWADLGRMLSHRMLLGIFLGQYCVNVLTWFFLTWFPIYLVKDRGMTILKVGFVATLPALCGFLGGVLGGLVSDALLRRGWSLSAARKTPIVAGMFVATSIVACNYVTTQWAVIFFMSLAFFGKGVGALGWALMSDVAPRTATGLAGGLFNTFGNLAGVVTPIVIGYILRNTDSFDGALVYVGAHALLATLSFVFIAGTIRRIELRPDP